MINLTENAGFLVTLRSHKYSLTVQNEDISTPYDSDSFFIPQGIECIIGRGIGSDVRAIWNGAAKDKSYLSRKHVLLKCQLFDKSLPVLAVKDLDSLNGVFVEGARVRNKLIKDGEYISLGSGADYCHGCPVDYLPSSTSISGGVAECEYTESNTNDPSLIFIVKWMDKIGDTTELCTGNIRETVKLCTSNIRETEILCTSNIVHTDKDSDIDESISLDTDNGNKDSGNTSLEPQLNIANCKYKYIQNKESGNCGDTCIVTEGDGNSKEQLDSDQIVYQTCTDIPISDRVPLSKEKLHSHSMHADHSAENHYNNDDPPLYISMHCPSVEDVTNNVDQICPPDNKYIYASNDALKLLSKPKKRISAPISEPMKPVLSDIININDLESIVDISDGGQDSYTTPWCGKDITMDSNVSTGCTQELQEMPPPLEDILPANCTSVAYEGVRKRCKTSIFTPKG